jgi:hypothetical protein
MEAAASTLRTPVWIAAEISKNWKALLGGEAMMKKNRTTEENALAAQEAAAVKVQGELNELHEYFARKDEAKQKKIKLQGTGDCECYCYCGKQKDD